MYEIDKEKFGMFLSQLRREKGMTQKDLAEKLFVSDKAVSKWERGLSLPDIALLQPLADVFDVTITELLSGQRMEPDQPLTMRETDTLVNTALHMTNALYMTAEEQAQQRQNRQIWGRRFLLALISLGLELLVLQRVIPFWDEFAVCLLLPPLMALSFGSIFIFYINEKLPAFYDQYRINFYSDGFFHMNFPGICFNNRNWIPILNAARAWSCITIAAWVPLYALLRWVLDALRLPWPVMLVILLAACLGAILEGLFIPICAAGRKYE